MSQRYDLPSISGIVTMSAEHVVGRTHTSHSSNRRWSGRWPSSSRGCAGRRPARPAAARGPTRLATRRPGRSPGSRGGPSP